MNSETETSVYGSNDPGGVVFLARAAKRWSQEKAARELSNGVTVRMTEKRFRAIETNKARWSITRAEIKALADVLGVDPSVWGVTAQSESLKGESS